MTTKWAFPEIEDFDDVANALGRKHRLFEFLIARPAQRPMKCGLKIYFHPSETTLAHGFLLKALHVDDWQFVPTFEQLAQLLAGYSTLVYPEYTTRIEPLAKSAFEEGKAYYERNKDLLIRKYNGKYIAIWENSVLDNDSSFSLLAQRVYEKLGYVSVYMPFVTSKRRVLRLESAKYRRSTSSVS